MKSKSMTSSFSKSIMGICFISFAFFASSNAMATGNCNNFTLTSSVTLLSPTGPAIGTATATMDDGTVMHIMAEGAITSTKVDQDGVIHMRVEELDNWGSLGTTIGLDKLKLTPTGIPGEYTLTIKTFLQGESGLLENVFGHYKGDGDVSFSTGQLNHSGSGKVCNLPF